MGFFSKRPKFVAGVREDVVVRHYGSEYAMQRGVAEMVARGFRVTAQSGNFPVVWGFLPRGGSSSGVDVTFSRPLNVAVAEQEFYEQQKREKQARKEARRAQKEQQRREQRARTSSAEPIRQADATSSIPVRPDRATTVAARIGVALAWFIAWPVLGTILLFEKLAARRRAGTI